MWGNEFYELLGPEVHRDLYYDLEGDFKSAARLSKLLGLPCLGFYSVIVESSGFRLTCAGKAKP